jgi:hypothetical protein
MCYISFQETRHVCLNPDGYLSFVPVYFTDINFKLGFGLFGLDALSNDFQQVGYDGEHAALEQSRISQEK